jgi:NTP pyrophosphatase (non-canonical NTP hydrolase)
MRDIDMHMFEQAMDRTDAPSQHHTGTNLHVNLGILYGASTSVIADFGRALNDLAVLCRHRADAWYYDINTGERLKMNDGERFMLMVTELAEAFEGKRKNLMDSHLPHRKAVDVELADLLIRLFDYAGENCEDLGGALVEKLEYNRTRADHTLEARRGTNGKKF